MQTPDGIKIVDVRVRNFRCLRQVNVELDNITILIGENNSGKTSFLEALYAAIGAGRRIISADDVFLSPGEKKLPKTRTVTVDLLIRPTDDQTSTIPTFPQGSYWLALWGNAVAQDDDDNDFIAIRTQTKWDDTRGEYITERRFLSNWPLNPIDWNDAKVNEIHPAVSTADIEPLALQFMDAKRDIQDDMQNRNSFWNRMVSDPGLTDDQVDKLEKRLTKLNEDIILASDVLRHVQGNLDDMHQAVRAPKGSVSITPTARTLRDLSRGMDVSFNTDGAQTFPVARHGMGTRSVASLLSFRAYTTWRQQQAKKDAAHPMLALEEPEAHLHPQAQRALFHLIENIPGQRIVSTHSPYIAAEARLSEFRVFRKVGPETLVARMDMSLLTVDEIRKIEQMVMTTRGDSLYARALVLCSGETEEFSLPVFARSYWKRHPNDLGITIQGVGGDGSYRPFLRLAEAFGIPWYIFSDGEPNAIKHVNDALAPINDTNKQDRVFVIPNGKSFEEFLASKEYKDMLMRFIVALSAKNQQHEAALKKEWASKANVLGDIVQFLQSNKTKCAERLAEAITNLKDKKLRFPGPIRNLLEKISKDHGLKMRTLKTK
jgi:putative ATP-dependent endonuclease of OLD family